MTDQRAAAIRQHLSKPRPWMDACACMGARPGEPVCRCRMAWVEVVDGRYFLIKEIRTPDGISHSAEDLGEVLQ